MESVRDVPNICVINMGCFRSGTTTLNKAGDDCNLRTYREFPDLTQKQQYGFLRAPVETVGDWKESGGFEQILTLACDNDLMCDGWNAMLPFLATDELALLKQRARTAGILLKYVATVRDVESTVASELHHWVVNDLERSAGLTQEDQHGLEDSLRARALKHRDRIRNLSDAGMVQILPLLDGFGRSWSQILSKISTPSEDDWFNALKRVGIQNANPPLPIEGILLTLRLESGQTAQNKITAVKKLLSEIEQDTICRYILVVAIDADERDSIETMKLRRVLGERASTKLQMQALHVITNDERQTDQPFPLCHIWHKMAKVAWENGAKWVMLLGDDINIQCSYHYRAVYRSFLDISNQLSVPLGFGCPWWNDISFPGFATFPCVGRAHFELFEGLIPKHRLSTFVNQDLDPYLHTLYLKFNASPCIHEAKLSNGTGGNTSAGNARYNRVPAQGWRDFVLNDMKTLRRCLPEGTRPAILLDVVVPSYRVHLDYLKSICSLQVPEYMQTMFIVIVDNRIALRKAAHAITLSTSSQCSLHEGERILEEYLSSFGNNVRVRCNDRNLGASASRNRGIDESAAEFILNLDDDLVPNDDLLENYGQKLLKIDTTKIIGLIGLVRFPRSPSLPLRHVAVLMSYLTFMFEIAEKNLYPNPAWGVTANILFRRTKVRFDLAYAKTGGGEDVDFSLRVAEATAGGKLLAVPEACVVHPFWPGSVVALSSHFFNWAVGDGGLLKRFPNHRYWSFPNFPETLLLCSPLLVWMKPLMYLQMVPFFLFADFVVDFSDRAGYGQRCRVVQGFNATDPLEHTQLFYISAHVLANLYVVILECGRLWGHAKRMDLSCMCHRFDWHCGQLENAPRNFRRREAQKFVLFASIIAYQCLKILPSS